MKVYIIIRSEKRYYLYNAEGVRISQFPLGESVDKFLLDWILSPDIQSFKISYTDNPDVRIVTIH